MRLPRATHLKAAAGGAGRSMLARVFKHLFDRRDGPANYVIARWIFLRLLGAIYFAAFLALAFQIKGMLGAHGILPAREYLEALQPYGLRRFWLAPSAFWLSSADAALLLSAWIGLAASVLTVLNILPRAALALCFVCFLSFVGVSQDFGQYQSDGMLVEAGFLSLFVAPAGVLPGLGRRSLAVRTAVALLLWEWFRIYFESGVVKLASGDPTWRNLTAMYEYYQNGPLPTWIGWYLQHLPFWFHRATAFATLFMELAIVWIAFSTRLLRIVCFWIVTVWQAGVILTANYAFLNYLVLSLGVLLLDDAYLTRIVPAPWRSQVAPATDGEHLSGPIVREEWREAMAAVATAVSAVLLTWVGYVTTVQLLAMVWPRPPLPKAPVTALEPLRIANSYGLFATMTPHRYEIEFQGSDDGRTWRPYLFRFKPQDVRERPRIYAPYQPRFDWNLWFASLGPWQLSPIVPLTEERLLEGDTDVLALFRGNPFASHPPKFVRAVLWQYWFSTPEEKRKKGIWWRRELLGTYAPTLYKAGGGRYGQAAESDLSGPPAP